MRVLGALRQSRTRKFSISLEDQRAQITSWAESRGHDVAGFTTDPSTSGSRSAFKRPGLGPYLTEPDKIVTWDILVTTKLDRACRDAADYLKLREWCLANGKAYVSLAESLDDSTPAGRAMGTVVAAFAQFERERASERSAERFAYLTEQGRWPGGRVPFGYRAEQESDGWYLVVDDGGTADVARRMARDAIGGRNNGEIARWLNNEGIPTVIGREWRPDSVRLVLTSPNISGLLDDDECAELTAALRSRAPEERGHWTSGEHMLLRVAFCWRCKDNPPMYGRKRSKRPHDYSCYECWGTVRKDWLEEQVDNELRGRWGNREHRVRAVRAGDSIGKDIRRLEAQLATAQELEFVDTSALEREIDRLRALPRKPDRVEFVATGQTISQKWDSLATDADKGAWLRANKVRVLTGPGRVRGRPLFWMEATWFASWE